MSDTTAAQSGSELLTGERTVPGVPEENYWFRRHEVVYQALAERCAGATVLEAGCGEGYGAAHLAERATRVLALDYDAPTVLHIAGQYPELDPIRSDLATLPVSSSTVDIVVNLQVIEHLRDQEGFLAECHRVLRPGGELLISTPNRITFSRGRDTPLNPFHTRELEQSELDTLLCEAGFDVVSLLGLHHGARLRELDAKYGGSLIEAQLAAVLGFLPGEAMLPGGLLADISSVAAADFDLHADDLDASLDLVAIAVRP